MKPPLYKVKHFITAEPLSQAVEERALDTARSRLMIMLIGIVMIYTILVAKLFMISLSSREDINSATGRMQGTDFYLQRATITDRNGTLLAVNLSTASLYANPSKIIDPKVSTKQICEAFQNIDCVDLYKRLVNGKTFVWVKRHLSPREQQIAHDLAVPGLYFINEEKRVYPYSNLFAHVLGYVDIDGNGIAGIEQYFNKQLSEHNRENLALSVDARVQQVLHEELARQVEEQNALGGSGLIMNVRTGEVIAMVSLPDFDPHHIYSASDQQRFNQVTLGQYEQGSTFKVLTLAMALDGGFINVDDAFNLETPIKVGNHRISDYKGKGGTLTVPEILMFSSNIGTAQIAMKVGIKNQRDYLREFGLLSPIALELPEKGTPLFPSAKLWSQSSLITISYGHGIAVSPLHAARAVAAAVNGGRLVKPTLLKLDSKEEVQYNQVIGEQASSLVRKVLRLVVSHGSGKRANVEGYFVGGKTGTAEKLTGGRYNKKANVASFISAFPIYDPEYVMIVIIDEAKPGPQNGGITTGGMVAAPVAGKIIPRIAPILGITPRDKNDQEVISKLAINFTPRRAKLN